MKYRVERLASACDVSVDTIRFYQSKGLLPAPEREGRVVFYGAEHVERIRQIKDLQRRGLTLAGIKRLLAAGRSKADRELAAAVAGEQAAGEELLSLDELADRSGVPAAVLGALSAEGIRLGRIVDGEERFTPGDVAMVRFGLKMLEAGLPMSDLLALAREHHEQVRGVAERAVRMFDEHIREPIRAGATTEEEAAERLVAAFRELLPAVTSLAAHHFRRVLLAVAEEHLERTGSDAEVAAAREEARTMEGAWPGA